MARVIAVLGFLVLTLATQVGGLILIVVWLVGRFAFPQSLQGWRRTGLMAALFVGLYAAASAFVVPHWAALAGRVPLPCRAEADRPFEAAHPLYCALNRHYVDARLVSLLTNLSRAIDRAYRPSNPPAVAPHAVNSASGFIESKDRCTVLVWSLYATIRSLTASGERKPQMCSWLGGMQSRATRSRHS
jgi:hypothetical protein